MSFQTFHVFGNNVELEATAGVLMPTANGLFYARSIHISPGERVIDIGTGSGVLAIAAAKSGAKVCAVDSDPRAVRATRHNAQRNGVTIDVRRGSLFADLHFFSVGRGAFLKIFLPGLGKHTFWLSLVCGRLLATSQFV